MTGQNFDLDPQQRSMRMRSAFDLKGTAPNGASIMGFAQLLTQSGTISTLVQAGGNVYTWDGSSTFTLVGTVPATSKLRGGPYQNFTLTNIVIITDLTLGTPVKQWDGTTFQNFTHNLGGSFYAKFCRVRNERALFANVTSGTATPHVFLGSALSDCNTLSTTNRPTSALSYSDAFYIPIPDLRPINGMETAFGNLIFSTSMGKLWKLSGTSSFDFQLDPFFEGSFISGNEAICNIGNDLLLGMQDRIETLSGVQTYGDVEIADVSLPIGGQFGPIHGVTDWTMAYDRIHQRAFCFPNNQSACWVLYKALLDPIAQTRAGGRIQMSPWSKWTTTHPMGMQPSCVMALKNPSTGEDIVYAGDTLGNIYQMTGDGSADGGTNTIEITRKSKVIYLPDMEEFNFRCNIDYRRQFPTTVTISFVMGGIESADATFTVNLSSDDSIAVYSGPYYYSGGSYYTASFTGKLRRQIKDVAARGNFLQVEVSATTNGGLDIEQIEILPAVSET